MDKDNSKWTEFTLKHIIDYCNTTNCRTFPLRELMASKIETLRAFRPDNHHIEEKIRQQLQILRDENKRLCVIYTMPNLFRICSAFEFF